MAFFICSTAAWWCCPLSSLKGGAELKCSWLIESRFADDGEVGCLFLDRLFSFPHNERAQVFKQAMCDGAGSVPVGVLHHTACIAAILQPLRV